MQRLRRCFCRRLGTKRWMLGVHLGAQQQLLAFLRRSGNLGLTRYVWPMTSFRLRWTAHFLDLLEGSIAKSRLTKVRRILQGLARQDTLIDSDPYISATVNKINSPFQVPPIKDVLLEVRRLQKSSRGSPSSGAAKSMCPIT